MRRAAQASAKPESQASSFSRNTQKKKIIQLSVLLALILWFGLPPLFRAAPDRIWIFHWKDRIKPLTSAFSRHIPPDSIEIPFITPQPLFLWVNWGIALFASIFCISLLLHLVALYQQRTKPLQAKHVYRQIRIPNAITLKPTDGQTLLKQLYSMLPKPDLKKGSATPLVLRWSALPNQPVKQGVSILDQGNLVTSITKVVAGVANRTRVEQVDDPLFKELQEGRFLCFCEMSLIAPDDIPLKIDLKDASFLNSLFPALTPQVGIICTDIQILLEPVTNIDWKHGVRARLEEFKSELSTEERKALEMKAEGPTFRFLVRLAAVTEDLEAAQVMLETISAAFAGTSQTITTLEQRLQSGALQVFPAIMKPVPSIPQKFVVVAWIFGFVLALTSSYFWKAFFLSWSGWLLPCLFVPLPVLLLATWWRKQHSATELERYSGFLHFVFPPRNPQLIPVWSDWFGRNN